ncbi:MAG: PEP-CTERM sorting domain-containing protein [Microcoleaceae cyanobacterium]
MKNLQSLFFGTTITLATVTAATLAPSPVQAAGLNGSIGLGGTAEFGNPEQMFTNQTTLGFDNHVINSSAGDLAGLMPVNMETLNLTLDGIPNPMMNFYNYEATTAFIDFGLVDLEGDGTLSQLTFDLDAGQVMRQFNPLQPGNVSINGLIITGLFNYEGEAFEGFGSFGASRSGSEEFGFSTSYQMTLGVGNGGEISPESPESVPEPSILLGLGTVLGMGALSRKKALANRQK